MQGSVVVAFWWIEGLRGLIEGMGETESAGECIEIAGLAGVNWYIAMGRVTKPNDLVGAESHRRQRKDSARRMGVSV